MIGIEPTFLEEQFSLKKVAHRTFAMDSYLTTVPGKHEGNFPFFRHPAKVGEFSLDERRDFQHDSSQRKYITWPSKVPLEDGQNSDVSFDLNLLLERAVKKDDSQDERLNNLLKWILENQSKFKLQDGKAPFSRFVKLSSALPLSWHKY